MGRQVEIPIRFIGQGQRELEAIRAALANLRRDTNDQSGAMAQFDRAAAKLDRTLAHLRDEMQQLAASQKDVAASSNLISDSYVRVAAAGVAIKTLIYDTATYAARTETLGIVTTQMAKVNHLNAEAVRSTTKAVREQGITTQEAYGAVTKMIQAQLDLSKATQLARVAQDAAVISGTNSSQALAGIIHGIVTRQPEVLRTYGIMVNFEAAYSAAAKKAGRELSATEKQQISMNAVLEQGAKIAGTYEAAMGTVGKQLTSLERYVDEAKNALGTQFLPMLSQVVQGLTGTAKHVEEHAEFYGDLTKAIGLATAALITFQATAKLVGALELGGGLAGLAKMGAGAAGTWTAGGFVAGSMAVPAGLAAGSMGVGGLLAYNQMQEQLERLQGGFDAATIDADKFRDKMGPIIEALQQGTGSAKDFNAAIKDAFETRVTKKMLPGLDDFGKADFKNEDFTNFLTKRGIDPGMAKAFIDTKSESGKILSTMLAEAYGKTFKNDLKLPFDLKITGQPKAPLTEEQLKKQKKEAEALAKELAEINDQIAKLTLPLSPYTNNPSHADTARLSGAAALRDASPGAKGARRRLNAIQQEHAQFQDYADAAQAGQKFKDELGRYEKFWEEAAVKLRLSITNQAEAALDDALEGTKAWSENVIAWARELKSMGLDQQRSLLQIESSGADRRAQLAATSGGSGPEDTIHQAYASRLNLTKQIYEIDLKAAADIKDALEKQKAVQTALFTAKRSEREAEIDHELQLLELQQKRLNDFREGAGRVFDAMKQNGKSGLRELLMGQVNNIERTMFQNVAGKMYESVGNSSSMPKIGGSLGWLFKGTPFEDRGSNALVNSQTKLTTATVLLTKAVQNATGMGGVGGVGGYNPASGSFSTVAAAASNMPGVIMDSYGAIVGSTLGNTAGGIGPAHTGPASTLNVGGYDPTTGMVSGLGGISAAGAGAKSSGASQAIGKAAGVGAAALGIYAGIKQGGAAGALNAAASGMMGASMFAGPAAPFLMAGAMAATLIGGFVGPNPDKRNAEIDRNIQAGKYTDANSIFRSIDSTGRDVDFDKRGNMRVMEGSNITINIKAFDSKSVMDAGPEIADSLKYQLLRSHAVADEFRQAVQ